MWLYGSIINVMSMGLVFSFNFVEDPSGRQKAQQQGQQRFGKQVAKPSGPSGRNDGSQVHEIKKWALRRQIGLKKLKKKEIAYLWAVYDVEK